MAEVRRRKPEESAGDEGANLTAAAGAATHSEADKRNSSAAESSDHVSFAILPRVTFPLSNKKKIQLQVLRICITFVRKLYSIPFHSVFMCVYLDKISICSTIVVKGK